MKPWLKTIVDRVTTSSIWPNDKPPCEASAATCVVRGRFDPDAAMVCLVQELIDEVERLRKKQLQDLHQFLDERYPKTNKPGRLLRVVQRSLLWDFLAGFEAANKDREAAEAAEETTGVPTHKGLKVHPHRDAGKIR